jgi:hypothetical protein
MLLGPNLLRTKPVMSRANSHPMLANILIRMEAESLPRNVINVW